MMTKENWLFVVYSNYIGDCLEYWESTSVETASFNDLCSVQVAMSDNVNASRNLYSV